MTHAEVLAGAEPMSISGGEHGVLVLHGFTGTPQSMRPLAEAIGDAGFTVSLPLLPGHGTSMDDMLATGWAEWSAAAAAALEELSARCTSVVVAGLSMGGTLALWLATRESGLAGLVLVNPAVAPMAPEVTAQLRAALDSGVTVLPGIGSDIADPEAKELAYDGAPVNGTLALGDALEDLAPLLGTVSCPILLFTSPQDHVVSPESGDLLAASVSGPVERVTLERSYHVATLDYDKDEIIRRSIEFARTARTAG